MGSGEFEIHAPAASGQGESRPRALGPSGALLCLLLALAARRSPPARRRLAPTGARFSFAFGSAGSGEGQFDRPHRRRGRRSRAAICTSSTPATNASRCSARAPATTNCHAVQGPLPRARSRSITPPARATPHAAMSSWPAPKKKKPRRRTRPDLRLLTRRQGAVVAQATPLQVQGAGRRRTGRRIRRHLRRRGRRDGDAVGLLGRRRPDRRLRQRRAEAKALRSSTGSRRCAATRKSKRI